MYVRTHLKITGQWKSTLSEESVILLLNASSGDLYVCVFIFSGVNVFRKRHLDIIHSVSSGSSSWKFAL